jgi:hypothetical protein
MSSSTNRKRRSSVVRNPRSSANQAAEADFLGEAVGSSEGFRRERRQVVNVFGPTTAEQWLQQRSARTLTDGALAEVSSMSP